MSSICQRTLFLLLRPSALQCEAQTLILCLLPCHCVVQEGNNNCGRYRCSAQANLKWNVCGGTCERLATCTTPRQSSKVKNKKYWWEIWTVMMAKQQYAALQGATTTILKDETTQVSYCYLSNSKSGERADSKHMVLHGDVSQLSPLWQRRGGRKCSL